MKTAFALNGGKISDTLGGCTEILLFSRRKTELFSVPEKLPRFLKEHGVATLVCNGIGNCTMDLLNSMGMEVIPGVSGETAEVLESYRRGTLTGGTGYSCADHGRSCGECPGRF